MKLWFLLTIFIYGINGRWFTSRKSEPKPKENFVKDQNPPMRSYKSVADQCELVNFHEWQNELKRIEPMLRWTHGHSQFYDVVRSYVEPIRFEKSYQDERIRQLSGVGTYRFTTEITNAVLRNVSTIQVDRLEPMKGRTDGLDLIVRFESFIVDLEVEVTYQKEKNRGFARILCLTHRFDFCQTHVRKSLVLDVALEFIKPRLLGQLTARVVSCTGNSKAYQRTRFWGGAGLNWMTKGGEAAMDTLLSAVVDARVDKLWIEKDNGFIPTVTIKKPMTVAEVMDQQEQKAYFPKQVNAVLSLVRYLAKKQLKTYSSRRLSEIALHVANEGIDSQRDRFHKLT